MAAARQKRLEDPHIRVQTWASSRNARAHRGTQNHRVADGPVLPKHRLSAERAAWKPHIPWTPPPGGVELEQMKSRSLGVAYGSSRIPGSGRGLQLRPLAGRLEPAADLAHLFGKERHDFGVADKNH